MAEYGLVCSGVLKKVEDESKVTPNVGTGPGCDWRIVNRVTVDNSTGPDIVVGEPVLTILPAEVRFTTTIRDMTAQEISDRDDDFIDSATGGALGKAMYLIYNAVLYTASNPHIAGLTPAQFKTAIENPVNQKIDEAAFKAWMKELL